MTRFDWASPLVDLRAIAATARLTRLVTEDSITEPARTWINKRAKAANPRLWRKLDDLVNCPWCVSVWVSVPMAFISIFAGRNRFIRAGQVALTASWIAGNVQIREPDHTPEQATAVAALVEAGFTHASSIDAVLNSNLSKLLKQD